MSEKSSLKAPWMGHEALPGFYGNLSPIQEYRLKEAYLAMFVSAGIAPKSAKVGVPLPEATEKHAKGGMFSFRSSPAPSTSEKFTVAELVAELEHSIAPIKPNEVLAEFRRTCRMDNPDALMLRFLRARKWELKKGIDQFGRTLAWRKKRKIDEILERGEQYYIDEEPDKPFILQFESGKVALHGWDKQHRPLVYIHVKNHDPKAQPESAMEHFTLCVIEAARMCLTGDVNTAVCVFDLSGFGLGNMDYSVVKFILTCFEQYYPECLGSLFIHRAPWVFSSVWAIIKGWIDPVVASKISFTKNEKDLIKFIDSDQIPKDMGGTSDFEYEYIRPKEGESRLVNDTDGRTKHWEVRDGLFEQLDAITLRWIEATTQTESDEIAKERHTKIQELCDQYWHLDPYVRARSIYDRNGTLGFFKPELASGGIAQPTL